MGRRKYNCETIPLLDGIYPSLSISVGVGNFFHIFSQTQASLKVCLVGLKTEWIENIWEKINKKIGNGCVWLGGGKVIVPDNFLSSLTKIESLQFRVKTQIEMSGNILDKIVQTNVQSFLTNQNSKINYCKSILNIKSNNNNNEHIRPTKVRNLI